MLICVACLLVGSIGFGFASAKDTSSRSLNSFGMLPKDSAAFAFKHTSSRDTDDAAIRESMVLSNVASRDISSGIAVMKVEQERERRAAEEAARREEQARIAEVEAAKAAQFDAMIAQEAALGLPDVDWSCGKEAFIAEWTGRIDAYLEGSPLSGYGEVFARAAWNNGVDPRWSPAIANTESSKGACCFRPFNAWGWMGLSSWDSWESAINAHVEGLATKYGYSISIQAARKYCPPTYMDWYTKTVNQMMLI